MGNEIKLGIIICSRYKDCAGGKCFRALKNREGAFERYKDQEIDLVGYSACGGCPGGNIEDAPEEMKKNGAEVIHFATGFVVGYPPCPYAEYFRDFISIKYDLDVVFGTHPIPQNYYEVHQKLGTWDSDFCQELIKPALTNEKMRQSYD